MDSSSRPQAGPSTPSGQKNKKNKRKQEKNGDTPRAKQPRVASPVEPIDVDDEDGPELMKAGPSGSVDPMEALENGDAADQMAALVKQGASGADESMAGGEANEEAVGPVPVRADEFEQEAEREVEASKGLDGAAAEEGKMKLVHQVRHQVSSPSLNLGWQLMARSLCLQTTRMSLLLSTNDWIPRREVTSSTLILSSTSPLRVLSAMRVFSSLRIRRPARRSLPSLPSRHVSRKVDV